MGMDRPNAMAGDDAARETDQERMDTIRGFLADSEVAGLHRLINERIRLGILSALAVNETLSFTELKQLLETTDGNLSVHARKLEDAGLIKARKRPKGTGPRTEFLLSTKGRSAFHQFLGHMEALIESTRSANDETEAPLINNLRADPTGT